MEPEPLRGRAHRTGRTGPTRERSVRTHVDNRRVTELLPERRIYCESSAEPLASRREVEERFGGVS
jgi:hypothetical protein